MIACCGRPTAASFRDPFADIACTMRRETIAEICSLWVALATALMSQAGSMGSSDWMFAARRRKAPSERLRFNVEKT